MDEKGVSGSFMIVPEEDNHSLYPMFFGISCAFLALRLLPEPRNCNNKWTEIRNQMLKGSAHLLELLVWTVQKKVVRSENSELLHKLENAQKEIGVLKKIRSEDAKANEKVVSIFAAREQSWFDERKKLRQQIGALMNDLRVLETKKEKSIFELGEKMMEIEVVLQLKDKMIEEAEQKKLDIEERLKTAENLADELRENVKNEAQRHSSEISKHKTAFIELVSNQRQLEAEMDRTLRQVEAARQELHSVLEQKDQLVLVNRRLSMEHVKMHKDLEQKDQILSAMLRKSKLDTAEKQMLLKEVKSSKAKRKQAELETARWKAVSECKHDRHSLRNMLSRNVNAKSDMFTGGKVLHAKDMISDAGNNKSGKNDYHFEYKHPEMRQGQEVFSFVSEPYLTEEIEEPKLIADAKHLESWINSEAEKYKIAIEQRRQVEVDAFVEQLRRKDENLEAYSWRLMSLELESKRFQSHIEELDHEIKQLRQDNMKFEAILLNREAQLHSLQEQLILRLSPPNPQKLNYNSSLHDAAMGHNTDWSRVKVVKRKLGNSKQEMKAIAEEISQVVENDNVDETSSKEQLQDIVLKLHSPNKETKEGDACAFGPDHFRSGTVNSDDVANAETSKSVGQGLRKKSNSIWKKDIHALGVSYKVKRLKKQLFMLERQTGKKESCENSESNNRMKGFYALMSLLNKQVNRYQSLQEKIDDLCMRMHENNLNLKCGGSTTARPEDETKRMEHFLEETFQLQRYIVATGQKMTELQANIASSFVADTEAMEKPVAFDIEQFADSIKMLLREVQRGLEVRISRVIGDLEGTLACVGFHTSQK